MIATLVLMFITSMGIFGFLSRAHVEQGAPVGDVAAQIELIDEKISAKRSEIEQAKTATKNLDDVVSQYMIKGKDERSVAAANNARKNQQKERDKLAKDIDTAQKEISKLQETKLPLTTQIRKIETEVGPIKYIAEFMYGSNADKSMLERAVTWMILIIIFVFDPLAVLLLIAGQISIVRASELRRLAKEEKNKPVETVPADPAPSGDLPKQHENGIDPVMWMMFQEIQKKMEKGELTLDNEPKEKPDDVRSTDAGNDVEVPVDTNSNTDVEATRVDDAVVADADQPVDATQLPADVQVTEQPTDNWQPANVQVTEENSARWQELEEQVANLKKKEQYMMKQAGQQITVPKKD